MTMSVLTINILIFVDPLLPTLCKPHYCPHKICTIQVVRVHPLLLLLAISNPLQREGRPLNLCPAFKGRPTSTSGVCSHTVRGCKMVSQVFEQHIQKHSPVEHGERLCQKCEQILGKTFANNNQQLTAISTSSLSSTPSSVSSLSSGQAHHSVYCRSYQVNCTLEKRG